MKISETQVKRYFTEDAKSYRRLKCVIVNSLIHTWSTYQRVQKLMWTNANCAMQIICLPRVVQIRNEMQTYVRSRRKKHVSTERFIKIETCNWNNDYSVWENIQLTLKYWCGTIWTLFLVIRRCRFMVRLMMDYSFGRDILMLMSKFSESRHNMCL